MQIRTIPWTICVGIVLAALASPGCSDGPSTTSSSSGGAGGAGGSGGSGEVVDLGHPATETVSAGEFAKSPKYKMIFTFGQPTQNQAKMTSSSYRMQGGLVGANESAP